jgi:hypothetical protein
MSKEKPVHKTSNEWKEADVAFDKYKVMEGKNDGRGWERTVQQFLQFAKPATVVSWCVHASSAGSGPDILRSRASVLLPSGAAMAIRSGAGLRLLKAYALIT